MLSSLINANSSSAFSINSEEIIEICDNNAYEISDINYYQEIYDMNGINAYSLVSIEDDLIIINNFEKIVEKTYESNPFNSYMSSILFADFNSTNESLGAVVNNRCINTTTGKFCKSSMGNVYF